MRYRPGLDGVRGLAVVAVLAYHADFDWARGGFLGVSAFFTLSGFLIATLLLREHNRNGTIDLRAFWTRRFRRLLPASLLGLGLATAYAVANLNTTFAEQFRGDAIAALAYVANWRFIFDDAPYAAPGTGEASVIQHFWSLAIEEQFYLVFPLLVLGLLAVGKGSRRPFAIGVAALLAASVGATLLLSSNAFETRVYYGTDTRAAELLAGVLLALAFERWPDRGRTASSTETTLRSVGAGVALVVLVAMWSVVDLDSTWLYPWGLLIHTALAALVIREAAGQGWVASALAFRPLREIGRISYGLYVYHFPIYLWTQDQYPDLDEWSLFALRLAITFVVAGLSFVLVEQPVRKRKGRFGPIPGLVPLGGVAVTALLVVSLTSAVDRQDELAQAQDFISDDADVDPTVSTVPLLVDAPTVSVFGDSTALLVARGVKEWGDLTGQFDFVEGYVPLGCGVGRGGKRFLPGGPGLHDTPEGCDWAEPWRNQLEAGQPDIAVVLFGSWDAIDRQLEGETQLRTLGDPVYDEFLIAEMRAATDLLLEYADTVIWLTQSAPAPITKGPDDPLIERIDAFNLLTFAALNDVEGVRFVDLDSWIQAWPGGVNDLWLRPDGTHLSNESAVVAAEWLGPAILRAHELPSGSTVVVDDVEPVPVTDR